MAGVPRSSDEHPFERLPSLLLNLDSIDTTLTELARLATEVVGLTSCGITMRYDGQLLTVGSSDARAEGLDETQYRAGQGPCLQAMETSEVVELGDLERETRWPEYLPTAREAGLRCLLSLPLTFDGDTFGAANVYGFERAHMFGETERRHLELFAARAAGVLQVARRLSRDTALLAQMEAALTSRTAIDQALGIIMAQQRCTATTAFQLLRRESQNSRRRLHDIAADLVERTSGQPLEPGRDFDA